MPNIYRTLPNLLQSQAAWFACVLSAAAGKPWLGASVALGLTAIHILGSRHKAREGALVLVAGLFGTTMDTVLLRLGLLDFDAGVFREGVSPYWMIALWVNFATILNYCLRWLKTRLPLAAALGAIGGPAAYYAGMKFGALHILHLPYSLVAIAVVWAIAVPLLLWIANRWNGVPARRLSGQAPTLFVAAIFGLALMSSSPAAKAAEVQEWNFKVFLDDKPIGTHRFTLTTDGDAQRMQTRARFKVKVMGIPFYTYEHDNRETWRNGCLAEIDAATNDNGEKSSVRGRTTDAALRMTLPGFTVLPGCVSTFAYWNPNFLKASNLLNSQNGKYEAIEVAMPGTETIDVRGKSIQATRHRFKAGGYLIEVWYSISGQWLALSSKTPQGRVLRYQL